MSLTGTLKSCQRTSIHWWERLQLAPIKSFHFLQSQALEFSNIKQPIRIHLKGGEKGKRRGGGSCFWATGIQLWLVRIHFSCDHLQPSDPNCFPSFWPRQDLYAYPRRKGQRRMYCANTLINAARFLKGGMVWRKRLIGKYSGTNHFPSSWNRPYEPDKDQHLKLITGVY